MPPDPLESFLFLNLLQINSAGKNTLENLLKFNAPSLKKFVNSPLTRNIFKGLFTPVSGSRRLTSLYEVNIQPISKLHVPYQNFIDSFLTDNIFRFIHSVRQIVVSYCTLQVFYAPLFVYAAINTEY